MRKRSLLVWRAPWIAAVCLGLALIGPGLAGVVDAGEKPKLIVWWNKGYYKEEDEAMQKLAAEFARDNNVEVDVTFTIHDDLAPKIIGIISLSGVVARRVPDVAFCLWTDWQISPKLAWEGKLTDVSDIINELKPRYIESHINTGRLFNKAENKWSYYAIPIEAQALGTHYWKDLVQEAGLNPDPTKIPMTWKEYWDFWKKVQNNLRKKDPAKYGKLYGIGMTESSRATDTFYNFEQYLLAFHGEVLSPEGKVVADEAKNREAIVKTLSFFTSIYREGYVPPDALKTWTDGDNNEKFLNKTVVMTPNPSISIPAAEYFTNKDVYLLQQDGEHLAAHLPGGWQGLSVLSLGEAGHHPQGRPGAGAGQEVHPVRPGDQALHRVREGISWPLVPVVQGRGGGPVLQRPEGPPRLHRDRATPEA